MHNNIKISVTSNSFSFNDQLTKELKEHFKNVQLKTNKIKMNQSELIEFLSDSDGAIVGLDQITKEVIDSLPKLQIISKYGVGLDNLDIDYLKKADIKIGWTPGINKTSVSELTIANMISLSRNIFKTSNELVNSEWIKNGGRELSELCVGIIGIGNIGEDVIKKLIPFGCKILANDIKDKSNFLKSYNIEQVPLEKLLKESDIISIHTPKDKNTINLINQRTIELMKQGSIVISTARGGIINEKDLYQALKNDYLKGAALDVFEIEPAIGNNLFQLKNFIGTPHIAGNSNKAVLSMGRSSIKHLVTHFKGNK